VGEVSVSYFQDHSEDGAADYFKNPHLILLRYLSPKDEQEREKADKFESQKKIRM
jgi:hypothetical protein